jgi:hypothetical protein
MPSCTTRTGPRSIHRRTGTTSRSTSRHPTTNRPSRISYRGGDRRDDRGSGGRDDLDDRDVPEAYERQAREPREETRQGEPRDHERREGMPREGVLRARGERREAMEESDRRWADTRASAVRAWSSAFALGSRGRRNVYAYEASICESKAFPQKVRGRPSSGWTCVPRDRRSCDHPRDRLCQHPPRNRRVLEEMRSRSSPPPLAPSRVRTGVR